MTIQQDIEEIKEIPIGIFELTQRLLSTEALFRLGVHIIKVVTIVLIAWIIVSIGKMLIRRFFSLQSRSRLRPTVRREKTLVRLLENALAYVIYFSAILAVLSEFIDVRGLIAGAGVLGLAIGFGAQSLVKDIIAGFFIIFEDQFSVGDYVEIGNSVGTVEEIGLRTTKVIAIGGEVQIIPNGSINEVVNYSINPSVAIIDVKVSYDSDLTYVEKLIEDYLEGLLYIHEELLSPPELIGVQEVVSTEVVFRIMAETEPAMQWAFARKVHKEMKLLFDENGVKIPYQQFVAYSHQEKKGEQTDESKRV